jgi:hypothetical protein
MIHADMKKLTGPYREYAKAHKNKNHIVSRRNIYAKSFQEIGQT